MFKLKKLQVLGFKSFCDRTELKFHGEGVAAIVGPNGCGKSNIAAAIGWVLGEQSAKSLRGARMEDVIFIGTRDRKPTGMAEVSLTLIDPEVYEAGGASLSAEPEVEVLDEMEDWDEAAVRARSLAETEHAIAEVQPLPAEEIAMQAESQSGDADAEADSETQEAAELGQTNGGIEAVSPDAKTEAGHVVLKIRRRKFKPQQYRAGEIVVTRRLFRSGVSEYLLNGKICRLRDIQDLFMGTGLGPESYAIIEQGRIGQILSSKPHDRRAVIEEAAGITKFKTRKRLAELRLEQSKQNLARIHDIFEEVTRQMNSLKRQASKAERYARLRDEMRARLRVVLAGRFSQFQIEAETLQAQLKELAAEMQTGHDAVQQMEAQHAAFTQRGYALEEDSRQNAQRLSAIALESERATARRQHNQERCAELEARTAASGAEAARTREQLTSLQNELAANQNIVASASAEVASAQAETAERQQQAHQAAATLADLEKSQEQRRAEIMSALSAAAEIRSAMATAQEHAASLEREDARLRQEMSSAASQIAAFGGERGQIAFQFESDSQAAAMLAEQIVNARSSIEAKRAAEQKAKLKLDTLRAEYATALGRRGSLETLIAEHGYSTESVKRLFQSGVVQKSFTPAGVLADFLEVEDRYESVVEDFLRDELNYVVVKSWDAADEGLRLLRSGADGRATFLVHPEDAQARFSFLFDESTRPAPRQQAVLPLKNCIRVLNGFGKSLEVILPKLGNGYIAPDASVARDLALENPNAFFLAPSGETFHNVTVTGGKQRSEGPLSMKRELRDVMRTLDELERALREQETTASLLAREITELTLLVDRLEEEKREAEKRQMNSGHALKQLDFELGKTQQRLSVCESESKRLQNEREEMMAQVAAKRALAESHESRRQQLEEQFNAAQNTAAEMRATREGAAQLAAQASAQLAALEERQRSARASLERIESMTAETMARSNALEQQIAAAIAEKQQRLTENQQLEVQLQSLTQDRASCELNAAELLRQAEQLRAQAAEIDVQLRGARQRLDAARDKRGEVAAQAAKLQSDVEHLSESCRNELNLGREELLAEHAAARLAGELLAAEESAVREMRARLEAMGPVNMMALEEYNEVAQRHGFLEAQRKDLLDSIENTQAGIRELDAVTRQKFEEAFEKINENFQFAFRKLFGGGQAFMRLTDVESGGDSGIDVIASPPGKKLQNVLLLSGGEKALTALALLMGIFQYQPSPFCLLDEVDAPLDEANVGRFTEMVREMSGQTQFILITHNKRTMTMAPVMYGVTMQEPGVSKIVSVRFGDERQAVSA